MLLNRKKFKITASNLIRKKKSSSNNTFTKLNKFFDRGKVVPAEKQKETEQRNIKQWEDQHEGQINAGSTLAADRCSKYGDKCSNVRRSLGWHSILECNPTPFHTTRCHA